jgi:hypothetical protein
MRRLAGAGAAGGAEVPGPSARAGSGPGARSRSGADGSVAVATGAAFFVAAAFFAGGSGSSGCTGRRNPSRSAFLRARSAWASSMDEEWLFTPIPRDRQRSSASLLVKPSSCASS